MHTATVRSALASASTRASGGSGHRRPPFLAGWGCDRHGAIIAHPDRVRGAEPAPGPRPGLCSRIDGGPRFSHNGCHHPERLRDRALRRRGNQSETPSAGAGGTRTRCQCPSDEETAVDFVSGLRCRECGRAYPAEALHVCDFCFGPLEVTYDYEAVAATMSRERIAAGPRTIWRYADLLPVRDAESGRPGRRLHPADPGRPSGRRTRAGRTVDQGRHGQSDRVLQGPGGVGGADQGAAARVQDRRLCLHGEPGQLGGRPRRPGRHGVGGVDPLRPRGGQDHDDLGLRRPGDRRRGQL